MIIYYIVNGPEKIEFSSQSDALAYANAHNLSADLIQTASITVPVSNYSIITKTIPLISGDDLPSYVPIDGNIIFNTTLQKIQVYVSGAWMSVG